MINYSESIFTSTSTDLNFERTFTVNHTPSSTEDFWVEIEDFSITNTNLTQYYTIGPKLNSQQLTISAATTTIKEVNHQPSNKITQIAPKGFQTINLGESDLDEIGGEMLELLKLRNQSF